MKSKRSRATDIPKRVKDTVWQRDGGACIFCGNSEAMPNMHFISRSKGGLGIPENIGTGCIRCHLLLDNSTKRTTMLRYFERYLRSQYPGWSRERLLYEGDKKCLN